jgi:glycosyltransferase involved in cell wall biosynthesis
LQRLGALAISVKSMIKRCSEYGRDGDLSQYFTRVYSESADRGRLHTDHGGGVTGTVEYMTQSQALYGAIALAAYHPEHASIIRQLRSIQNQTHEDFSCIIAVDGGAAEVDELVLRELGGDARFRVIGFENRLGFYRNFERVLRHVPPEAEWVALSDQDDYWYPDKLETLLPHLANASLVSGQARVITSPENIVLARSTSRKQVGLRDLVFRNQVTGALSVFRRDLLDVALPFPGHNSRQLHDHWLGVCAAATGGLIVRDEVVQDYVQHGNNALGEAAQTYSIHGFVRRIMKEAEEHYGDRNIKSFFRVANDVTFGWSRVMLNTLVSRIDESSQQVDYLVDAFRPGHRWGPTFRAGLASAKAGEIGRAFIFEFFAGIPYEIWPPRRSSHEGFERGVK